ncbi:amidohydrolase family protein [Streptosporangium soli]|nr:hypothetical protein [Streptosporangium sp. KLBMP 9127]
MPDVNDLGEYVTSTLAGIAPAYQPRDMYVGTRLAALTAIDSGITTMLDFSHNSRTAAHSDAAIRALADTGIRGVHASMRPHFGDWDGQWAADLTRLHDTHVAGNPLLTLRLAALATGEVAGPGLAYGEHLARAARDLGIGVSIDAVFGLTSSEATGLVSESLVRVTIHAVGRAREAECWDRAAASGTSPWPATAPSGTSRTPPPAASFALCPSSDNPLRKPR